MEDRSNRLQGGSTHLLSWIWSVLLVLQMVLAFFVFADPTYQWLRILGWVIWGLGVVFALVPIFTLRTRGGVERGQSYMKTRALVDTGIYAIVRHPQGGTAGVLFCLALVLIGQHWLLVVLAAVTTVLLLLDLRNSDQACIDKFGEEYLQYMRRVPGIDFVSGARRYLREKAERASSN